jgi:hypothetical protein
MSTMLEQAIVDASALREAAIQNAEQAVVAKFSTQIKETVETLLEQDEMGLEAPAPEGEVPKPAEPPIAAAEESYGKDEEAPKDKDDESVIGKQLDDITGKAYAFGDSTEKSQFALGEDELIEIDLEQIVAEGVVDVDEQALQEVVEESEMIELDDEELEQLEEKITFDHEIERTGWMSGPDRDIVNAKIVHAVRKEIEELNDEALDKKEKESKKILAKLKRENKTLKTNNTKLAKERKEISNYSQRLLETITTLKDKFDEVQLMNAKLLYTNKVLTDPSLNRRQKNEIAESINRVDNIDKAKIVYETLQSAVGASSRRSPKSLSEAVERHASTSLLLKAQKGNKEENTTDMFAGRMKKLAGINKN